MRREIARCLGITLGISLAACGPTLPGLPSFAAPSAVAGVPSLASPFETATQPPAASATPVLAENPTVAFTPIPTLTPTSSLPTAITQPPTPTATVPAATATVIEEISLDKLPPNIPYKRVRIENQAHEQMDISLHCTTAQGLHTVIERSNVRNLALQAPEGDYVYVLYVGGHPMIGSFSLFHVPNVTLTVYKDRVVIH